MLDIKYLTVAEVAKVLRLDPESVGTLCREGKLPATKPAGRWLIAAADFEAFIEAGRKRPAGDAA